MSFVPASNIYHKPLVLSQTTPASGRYFQELARHICAVVARGNHHFSRVTSYDHHFDYPNWDTDNHIGLVKPSANANYLYVSILVQAGDSPDGYATKMEMNGDGDDSYNSSIRYIGTGLPINIPETLDEIVYEFPCDGYAGEVMSVWWNKNGTHDIHGITVFDSPISILESDAYGYLDLADYAYGKTITTTTIGNLVEAQREMIYNARRCLVNTGVITCDGYDNWTGVEATDTWVNAIDGYYTEYDAYGAGFWIRPSAPYRS